MEGYAVVRTHAERDEVLEEVRRRHPAAVEAALVAAGEDPFPRGLPPRCRGHEPREPLGQAALRRRLLRGWGHRPGRGQVLRREGHLHRHGHRPAPQLAEGPKPSTSLAAGCGRRGLRDALGASLRDL
eukprot:9545130-Alexandrium_andersonii.AAC.1